MMIAWIERFFSHLTPAQYQGVVLYLISMAIVTAVSLWFMREWADGLKGDNGRWEGPEIILYLCCWLIPAVLFADVFLQLRASQETYWLLMGLVFSGLFGRFGLQWILALRTGQSEVKVTTERTVEKEVVKEQKTEPLNA